MDIVRRITPGYSAPDAPGGTALLAVRTEGGDRSMSTPSPDENPPKRVIEVEPAPGLSTISEAIEDIAEGKMVILVDDEDRENEGDLCMAAEKVTPEAINFMARFGRGLICLPLEEEQLDRLHLGMMVPDYENTTPYGTAFTVSIEAREGVTTGISAADRARTVLAAVADDASPNDIVRPGHIFPLRAREGGVLRRVGQTEGSVDLARLAGCKPAGVICEIMNDDGTMARLPDLRRLRGGARSQDRHDQGPGRVPPAQRAAGAAIGRRADAHQFRRLPRRSYTRTTSTTSTTWPS